MEPMSVVMLIFVAAFMVGIIAEVITWQFRGGRIDLLALARLILIAIAVLALATVGTKMLQRMYIESVVYYIINVLQQRVDIYTCAANAFLGAGILLSLVSVVGGVAAAILRALKRLGAAAISSAVANVLAPLGRALVWFFVFLVINVGASFIVALFGLRIVLMLLLDPRLWISIALAGLSLTLVPGLRGFGASLFASAMVLLVMVPLMCFVSEQCLNAIAVMGVDGVSAPTYNQFLIRYAENVLGVYTSAKGCPTLPSAIQHGILSLGTIYRNMLLAPGEFYINVVKFTTLSFAVPAFIYGFFLSIAATAAVSIARIVSKNESITEAVSSIMTFVRR